MLQRKYNKGIECVGKLIFNEIRSVCKVSLQRWHVSTYLNKMNSMKFNKIVSYTDETSIYTSYKLELMFY